MPWTFSMQPVDVGRLLLLACQEVVLQRRLCRTKDWPYSQAAPVLQTASMLWTFSMQPVDVGRLLLSAWQDVVLQRRLCRTKDWPYSQAASSAVRVLF
jgi:hypothetical protein